MHIAAMILGILGVLSIFSASLLGLSLGAVSGSSSLQAFSLAVPAIGLVGAGVVMKNGLMGGLLMLVSAGGVLWVIGANPFGFFLSLFFVVGGLLGLFSGKRGKPSSVTE